MNCEKRNDDITIGFQQKQHKKEFFQQLSHIQCFFIDFQYAKSWKNIIYYLKKTIYLNIGDC